MRSIQPVCTADGNDQPYLQWPHGCDVSLITSCRWPLGIRGHATIPLPCLKGLCLPVHEREAESVGMHCGCKTMYVSIFHCRSFACIPDEGLESSVTLLTPWCIRSAEVTALY